MDVKTKRKLFGTVLNMGDIYLNIYSEIYLSDKKEPKKTITKNSRSTARKKNILSPLPKLGEVKIPISNI